MVNYSILGRLVQLAPPISGGAKVERFPDDPQNLYLGGTYEILYIRALGSAVERFPDDKGTLTYQNSLHSWARGSVVERFPDKKEVLGSIPSAPTNNAKNFVIRKRCQVRLLERPL